MLALTRRKGESVMVGKEVEVVVLGVHGDQVKLGFAAPKNISIHRKEIFEQILEENRAASKSGNFNVSMLKELRAAKNLKGE
jgi:carbon storage regulator